MKVEENHPGKPENFMDAIALLIQAAQVAAGKGAYTLQQSEVIQECVNIVAAEVQNATHNPLPDHLRDD